MKVTEIRALHSEELTKQLATAYRELFDLGFRLATKQLINHRQIRQTKKKIAQLKTIMRERELNLR